MGITAENIEALGQLEVLNMRVSSKISGFRQSTPARCWVGIGEFGVVGKIGLVRGNRSALRRCKCRTAGLAGTRPDDNSVEQSKKKSLAIRSPVRMNPCLRD